VKLTAVFESWHIADGNYPPLAAGQPVNLSFEVNPSVVEQARSGEPESFVHLGGGEYDFTATVLRIYRDETIIVLESRDFRFYMNRALLFKAERIRCVRTADVGHAIEIETMGGREFDEEFYLLDLTDEGLRDRVGRTFLSRSVADSVDLK
jgi:hypothetical protein